MPPTHGKPSTYHAGCRCAECKAGASAWAKERYKIRGEEIRAGNRASYARHRERRREDVFRASYGIGYAERDAMLAAQDHRCAICRCDGRLEMDHCHTFGNPRGFLCGPCNRAIGIMCDDPARLRAAADYLERVPQ